MAKKKTDTTKAPANAVNIESVRRVRAIRRLARPFPAATLEERLGKIGKLATGELDPGEVRRVPQTVAQISKRLADAAASRPASRQKKDGHDRKEDGGLDRSG